MYDVWCTGCVWSGPWKARIVGSLEPYNDGSGCHRKSFLAWVKFNFSKAEFEVESWYFYTSYSTEVEPEANYDTEPNYPFDLSLEQKRYLIELAIKSEYGGRLQKQIKEKREQSIKAHESYLQTYAKRIQSLDLTSAYIYNVVEGY